MASYELSSFDRFQDIYLVGAIEQTNAFSLNVGYWLRDPNQMLEFPPMETQDKISFGKTPALKSLLV